MRLKSVLAISLVLLALLWAPNAVLMGAPASPLPLAVDPAVDPDPYEPDNVCSRVSVMGLLEAAHTFHASSDVDWYKLAIPPDSVWCPVNAYPSDPNNHCLIEVYQADCVTLVTSGQDTVTVSDPSARIKISPVGGWVGGYSVYHLYPASGRTISGHVYRTGTQLGLANATINLWAEHPPSQTRSLWSSALTEADGAYEFSYTVHPDDWLYLEIEEIDPPGCTSTSPNAYKDNIFTMPGVYDFYDTPPLAMGLAPTNGSSCVGTVQEFVASVTDQISVTQISAVEYLIDAGSWQEDAVYVRYNHETGRLHLRNDGNTAWLQGYAPGTNHVVANSRARLHVDQSEVAVSADGRTLTVTFALEFLIPFGGTYNQYLYTARKDGFYMGFDRLGEWTVDYCGSPTPTATATATPVQWSCGTHTLQYGLDGYMETEDVGISSWYPNDNLNGGINDAMAVRSGDQLAGLIRFDLGMVPSNADITQATLSLYAARWHEPYAAGRTVTVEAYKVYRRWLAGEATWNRARAGVPWGAPGCNDTTTDRASASAASVLVGDVGRWYDFDLTALVQEWVMDPSSNLGIVLKGTATQAAGVELVTMEHGGQSLRPKLVVQCELPPTVTPAVTPTATSSRTPTPTVTVAPTRTPTATATAVPTGVVCTPLDLRQGVDGYTGVADASISAWYPDENSDGPGHDTMKVRGGDQFSGLIKFDLEEALPAGAEVVSATLNVYAWEKSGARQLDVGAYEVLRQWAAPEVTWNEAEESVPWGTAGCNGVGTDRVGIPAATVTMSDTLQWYGFVLTDLVRGWLEQPTANQGVILKAFGPTEEFTLVTSDHGASQLRPYLHICYALPTPTPSPTPTVGSRPIWMPLLLKPGPSM